MEKYIIKQSPYLGKLEMEVNKAIDKGYTPTGGVFVTESTKKLDDSPHRYMEKLYNQAMYNPNA